MTHRPRDSGEEDLQEILHSHEEPGAWASVTHSGGYYYVRSWATEEAAKAWATTAASLAASPWPAGTPTEGGTT